MMGDCGGGKLLFVYLVALEYRLTMRNLMLLQAVTLFEAFKAVFALKLWLMRHKTQTVVTGVSLCFCLSHSWLAFHLLLIDLLMFGLFVLL